MNHKHFFLLENLGCANCAAKMERKIGELPGVESVSVTFATKQLCVIAENIDELLPQIQKICSSIESEVVVSKWQRSHRPHNQQHSHEHHHEHEHEHEHCSCQEHHHNHEHDHEQCTCHEHHHDHGHKHDHEHEHKLADDHGHSHHHGNEHSELVSIIIGALFFAFGLILESVLPVASIICFVISYLILGAEILWTALKNLVKGNVFDENFLMGIATIGALIIAQYEEAVGVMLFYRIGEWFEHRAVARSRSQIMEALDLRPESVNLVQGDSFIVLPAEEAKVGDILLVRPGDRIPLDSTVTEGESRIDTSPVTGEPVPVSVSVGNTVTSGCINTSGLLKIKVDKPLEDSYVSRILDSVENAAASKPQIDRFITRFARVYTPFVVIAALATAILPSLITGDWEKWIYTALTFLVISCPCALVLSVPLAFFSGIGAGSKQKILFKGGLSMEALKNVRAVVMDKTGTLTKGNFVLQQITVSPAFEKIFREATTDSPDADSLKEELLSYAAICESASTHPIAGSIIQAATEKKLVWEPALSIEEIPGLGIKATTGKGILLCGNHKLLSDSNIDLSAYQQAAYGTEVLLSLNGIYIGSLLISDTIKEDAVDALKQLGKLGIKTAMLTGDSLQSAKAVAGQIGLSEVHAGLLPHEKLEKLQEIRSIRGSVMFVGDGINDAPVLAGADVGAAMGSGADAAIEAADVVFMTSDADAIPTSIRIAKETGRIAMQNVVFALIIKAAVMVLGLLGHASMWFAVFADSGVAMLCVLNSIRILYKKKK